MTKMLICPKCGLYQEDTTTIRKTGVAAKKAALFAGQQVVKQGTKMAASFVGLDGEYSQRAAGMLGSEAAKAIGLDPSKASISDVKYKCSSCACYWEGLDVPTLFNQIQLDTVRQAREAKLEELRVNFKKSWKRIVYATIFVALSFLIWSGRSSYVVTNSILGFTSSSTSYSWHYYVFWPMIVVSGFALFIAIGDTIESHSNHKKIERKSNVDYAQEYMELGV